MICTKIPFSKVPTKNIECYMILRVIHANLLYFFPILECLTGEMYTSYDKISYIKSSIQVGRYQYK